MSRRVSELLERGLDAIDRTHFSKVKPDRLGRVTGGDLRTGDQLDRLLVPILREGARRVLDQAHSEAARKREKRTRATRESLMLPTSLSRGGPVVHSPHGRAHKRSQA